MLRLGVSVVSPTNFTGSRPRTTFGVTIHAPGTAAETDEEVDQDDEDRSPVVAGGSNYPYGKPYSERRRRRRNWRPWLVTAAVLAVLVGGAAVGLPGFQFIQDPMDYFTRTHHSNADVYDRVQADDLKQASTIMAAFLWHTATIDEKLPRKPLQPN